MALGIADNLLTTVYLAASCPVILVPSMNDQMSAHPAVRENLPAWRAGLPDPGAGYRGTDTAAPSASGRMPEPQQIHDFIRAAVALKDFKA